VNVEYSMPRRVRESDLTEERDAGVLAADCDAGRERRPFSNAVSGEDGGVPRRRRQERRRCVGLVVPGEENLPAIDAEVRRDDAAHPDLFAERVLHGMRERTPRSRECTQRARENPCELEHAAFVEHDGIEVAGVELRVVQAPLDRVQWESRIVLPS
jgi:hypothetical protein